MFQPPFFLCCVQVPEARQVCQLSLQRILSPSCACLLCFQNRLQLLWRLLLSRQLLLEIRHNPLQIVSTRLKVRSLNSSIHNTRGRHHHAHVYQRAATKVVTTTGQPTTHCSATMMRLCVHNNRSNEFECGCEDGVNCARTVEVNCPLPKDHKMTRNKISHAVSPPSSIRSDIAVSSRPPPSGAYLVLFASLCARVSKCVVLFCAPRLRCDSLPALLSVCLPGGTS